MTSYIQELVFLAAVLYLLASACYFIGNEKVAKAASVLAVFSFLLHTLALVARTVLVGRIPATDGAEFLLSFAWFTVLIYIFYEYKSRTRNAGGVVMAIATLLVGFIVLKMPGNLEMSTPIQPALKSPYLTAHVLTAVFAYSGFALATGLAAVRLRSLNSEKEGGLIYRIILVSFAMLTLTIVLGGIWAEQAWGRYWSWDPKETWALITWIVYAVYLHLQRKQSWNGRKSYIIVIAGFVIVLFTFFGVNYLLSGLHSYN